MDKESDAPPKWVRWLWETSASPVVDDEADTSQGLSIGKIVRAGVALADDEGLEGVTVRKLAQRLGASTMAAYRHIDSREEVIAAMVDVAFGPPPDPSGLVGPWADGARAWAYAVHARYEAHPWLLDAPVQGMPTGPNRLRWMESALRVLSRAGLDLQEQLDAALLIDGHVRTVAALRRSLAVAAQAGRHSAPSAWLMGYLEGEGLSSMAQVLRAEALDDGQGYEIHDGLERIIAGIEVGNRGSVQRGSVGTEPHVRRGNSSREKTDSTGTSK